MLLNDINKNLVTFLRKWKAKHPGIEFFISPPNADFSRHIMMWRSEEIWFGPDYIVSLEEFNGICANPGPFLTKAYRKLLQMERKKDE